ncbi:hypothetical protein P3509_29250, partial [Vibrio parahaemolyticus]|nr:hypothetical protein [Vibrio parahaemolyticus]
AAITLTFFILNSIKGIYNSVFPARPQVNIGSKNAPKEREVRWERIPVCFNSYKTTRGVQG